MMDKAPESPHGECQAPHSQGTSTWLSRAACTAALLCLVGFYTSSSRPLTAWPPHPTTCHSHETSNSSVYGEFPKPDDPFLWLPCTNTTLPPDLDDADPQGSWSKLFDPNPEHWTWGNTTSEEATHDDPYAGRGIYLCGYLDVPLDYLNKSETRIVRLATSRFQVSGLARAHGGSRPGAGQKSERTLVVEPGGPGGSGTALVSAAAEELTGRFAGNKLDVLGWDPRGVKKSLPAISCFPYDADRDRWSQLAVQYREVSAAPRAQLELADAMNDAIFNACREIHGDLPRFMSTTSVARDLEEIRIALGEDELTGYLISYGTGIGQTYAAMFPGSVGRMVLDGTEYVRDHRLLGGFGWTALDNVTDAWHDGFIGECINAGPKHCVLAQPVNDQPVTAKGLQERLESLVNGLIERPVPGYTNFSGPSLITYSGLVSAIYGSMYNAKSWPQLAQMLYELGAGNSTLAAAFLEHAAWEYDPSRPSPPDRRPRSDELGSIVICADAYDAPPAPDGLDWWESLWSNMTHKAWISGNSRFANVFPCRHFVKYWPEPSEVYRGDLNHTLKHPILLIAETHDPATPLRNGRRLLDEMGRNARLIVHHGYGHSSRDTSNCTESIASRFILEGVLPDDQETNCYADKKPYLYDVGEDGVLAATVESVDPIEAWRTHIQELAQWNPEVLSSII